jgi:hypothetical protein
MDLDAVRARLRSYGYEPTEYFNPKGTMRLRYLPTGKIEYLRMRQFETRIQSGRLVRVNWEPRPRRTDHALTGITRLSQESAEVQQRAQELYAEYSATIQERRDTHADYIPGDKDENMAKVYAMIACLRSFNHDREHRAAFMVQWHGTPSYMMINESAVNKLLAIIQAIWVGDVNAAAFQQTSQMPMTFKLIRWERMGFEFVRERVRNALDPPINNGRRRARNGGYLPYINTGPEDLSKYGIYSSFDPENYKMNCLIPALNLNLSYATFLRSVIITWELPFIKLYQISRWIQKNIWVNFIEAPAQLYVGAKENAKKVNVFWFMNHFCVYDRDVKEKVKRVIPFLRPMTIEEDNLASRGMENKIYDIIPYPACAVVKSVPLPPSFPNPSFTSDPAFPLFRKLMVENFGKDPEGSGSMGNFSLVLTEDLLADVPHLCGYLASQINWCRPSILLGCKTYPLKVEGDLVCVDRNGSYTSVYTSFPGIPVYGPTIKRPESPGYYYVKINVLSLGCNHEDPFPVVHLGINWVDKTTLEFVDEHYIWVYEIIGGWYFKEIRNPLQSLAFKLWELRLKNPEAGGMIKLLLNSMYGKSLQRGKEWYKKGNVSEVRAICAPLQRPQFGVNVYSWSRKQMQEILFTLIDSGVEVFHVNTDSFLIRKSDLPKFPREIGRELGQFKIEKECVKFICLSQKKWWMRLKDGTEKRSFGQEGEDWWEQEYERAVKGGR